MTRTLTALAAAATIAVTAIAVPQQAEARWRGGGAVIGGLAAGALIGGAVVGSRYYTDNYGYGGYAPYYSGYGDYGPYAYAPCFRERVITPWGWRWRQICR